MISGYFKALVRSAILVYSVRSRTLKANKIDKFMSSRGLENIVFCGAVDYDPVEASVNESVVENYLATRKTVIGAYNIYPADCPWPFFLADGREMPFRDASIDFLLSNAIIEHVGDEKDQQTFVDEHVRVGKGWAITTPNKWFPIESHTSVMFLHWLPSWRKRHKEEFTRLLSKREFKSLLPDGAQVIGGPFSPTFTALYSR